MKKEGKSVKMTPFPKDPAVYFFILIYYHRGNSFFVEISCEFSKENKVFQRPCHSVFLPSYFFATTVVNQYDRSIFNMAGPLGFELVLPFSDLVAPTGAGRPQETLFRLFRDFWPEERCGLSVRSQALGPKLGVLSAGFGD